MNLATLLSALLLSSGALAFAPAPPQVRISSHFHSTSSSIAEDDGSRRSFLSTAGFAAGMALMGGLPQNAYADGADYKAVAKDIADIIKKDPNKGATLVRLVSMFALHCIFV